MPGPLMRTIAWSPLDALDMTHDRRRRRGDGQRMVVPSADRDRHITGRPAVPVATDRHRADVHVAFPVDVILINSSARTPSEHHGASNPEPNR